MNFLFHNRKFDIKRYPASQNHSLRPWSAADEHLLRFLEEEKIRIEKPCILHDRFGFLTCILQDHAPVSLIGHRSQEKAIHRNLGANDMNIIQSRFAYPLDNHSRKFGIALMKIPKSLGQFKLYLAGLVGSLKPESTVLAGFMTRHFSAQMLSIAGEFFGSVTQSKAWKKSRILILKEPKALGELQLINEIEWGESKYLKQYLGVFSGKRIDSASRFLLENLEINEADKRLLDLGCGSGVLALALREKCPNAEIHLLDDSYLAIESAKLNIEGPNTHFHFKDSLEDFEDDFFDRVVCNPPFHFEYEIDISISLSLFQETARVLRRKGRFQLVANRHLNYQIHLEKLFSYMDAVAVNEKYVIYSCVK